MANDNSLDDVRRKALDSYEFWDKLTKLGVGVAAAFELGLGVALIWLTDFSDPVQRLLFLATAAIYAPLVVFIIAIGCHAERNTQRILRAIQSLSEPSEED